MLIYDTKKWIHVVITAGIWGGAPFNKNNIKLTVNIPTVNIPTVKTQNDSMRESQKINTLGTPFAQTRWGIYIHIYIYIYTYI